MRTRIILLLLFFCLPVFSAACFGTPDPTEAPSVQESMPPTPEPTPEPTPVMIGGSVMENGTLRAVVKADDFALIEQIEGLETLDVSGSDCYDAILAYQSAHPSVNVLYTVPIGDVSVSSETQELTVSHVPDSSLLVYLPALRTLTVTEPIAPKEAADVLKTRPDVDFDYSVSAAGMTVPGDAAALDLSEVSPALSGEIAEAVAVLPNLTDVNLNREDGSSDWTLQDAIPLMDASQTLRVDLNVTAFGRTFSLTDDVVDFNNIPMEDKEDALLALLPYLRNVGRLDMENCRLSDERMAELRAQYPSPKIVWRVNVGAYSCRTDSKIIRFSMFYMYPQLYDRHTKGLTYCNEVRYLDLGHNMIQDAYFVGYMPDLEVCILAIQQPTDISAFRNCKHLEYAELFNGSITDVSALAECTELRHLNLCMNQITDITPLYGLTNLERLWISRNPIPEEQIERFKELVPDCVVNTTAEDPTINEWRYDYSQPNGLAVRYALLQKQFAYSLGLTSSVDLPDLS